MTTHILIADDHPLFRSAMKQAVESVLHCEITQASNFDECVTLLDAHPQIDLVLLDLNMPGNNGLAGLSSLRTHHPDVQVVMVSATEDTRVIRRAIDYGACGYIPKSAGLDTIQHALKAALEGDTWLPEDLASRIEGCSEQADLEFAARLETLTPQQFKVLSMVADGMLNKQIAYEMNVQETTVKQHVSAILKKLQVINRLQAGVMFKQMLTQQVSQQVSDAG